MIHVKDVGVEDLNSNQDEKVQIQYKDFPNSSGLNVYLRGMIQGLQHESPSDSVLKVTFSKTGRVFKGIVNIYSRAGRFFARAEDININAMSHKLAERARRQINKWKTQRFRIHKELADPEMP